MDKYNYISNIYKVSKYLQKYINNNSDFYLQKINNYIEKTHANQHGGTIVDVQHLVQELIGTVQRVIIEHVALKKKLQELQLPELPKIDLINLKTIEQIVGELVKQNPKLEEFKDIMIKKLKFSGRNIRNDNEDDLGNYIDDLIDQIDQIDQKDHVSDENRKLILDEVMILKGRDLYPKPQSAPQSAPQPVVVQQTKAPSVTHTALQSKPVLASSSPSPLLPSSPLLSLTAEDIIGIVTSSVTNSICKKILREKNISGSILDTLEPQQLDSLLTDNLNDTSVSTAMKPIIKRLLVLKENPNLRTLEDVNIKIAEKERRDFERKISDEQKLHKEKVAASDVALKLASSAPQQQQPQQQRQQLSPFGRIFLVQAVKINPETHMRFREGDRLDDQEFLTYQSFNKDNDEGIITRKIKDLFNFQFEAVGFSKLPEPQEPQEPQDIFVTLSPSTDMQGYLKGFNNDKKTEIKLSDGNTYRLFAIYKTQREDDPEYNQVNEVSKVKVNREALAAFIKSITPEKRGVTSSKSSEGAARAAVEKRQSPIKADNTLTVQAVLIDQPTGNSILTGENNVQYLKFQDNDGETIAAITKKIRELFRDGILVEGGIGLNKRKIDSSISIFVNFVGSVDIHKKLQEFNSNIQATITLSNKQTYRFFATYKTNIMSKDSTAVELEIEASKEELNSIIVKNFNKSIKKVNKHP